MIFDIVVLTTMALILATIVIREARTVTRHTIWTTPCARTLSDQRMLALTAPAPVPFHVRAITTARSFRFHVASSDSATSTLTAA